MLQQKIESHMWGGGNYRRRLRLYCCLPSLILCPQFFCRSTYMKIRHYIVDIILKCLLFFNGKAAIFIEKFSCLSVRLYGWLSQFSSCQAQKIYQCFTLGSVLWSILKLILIIINQKMFFIVISKFYTSSRVQHFFFTFCNI